MQSIITKKLDPTDTKGARIKAKCDAGTITVGYDDALSYDQNHRKAAEVLCQKLDWDYVLVSGSIGAERVHTPLYDRYAKKQDDGILAKYRPYEIERVAKTIREAGDYQGRLQCYGVGGVKTRFLTISEREVGALIAIFNQID